MSAARRALVPGGLLLLAVTVALWPLPAATLRGELLGHPISDLADHVQGAWWVAGELLAGRWPDTTTVTHVPEALALWYVDPVGALLMLPLWPLGVALAWNGMVFVQVLAGTLAAAAAGTDLSGSRVAGLVAGVVAGPSAYVLGLVHSGLSEMLGTAPVVLATWATLRATGRDPRGRPVPRWMAPLAAGAIGLCAIQAPYTAVFAALFVACCGPGTGWRGRLWPVAAVLGLGALACVPGWLLVQQGLAAEAAAITAETAPGWSQQRLPGTDLLGFLRPGRYYHPDTPALGNPGILHVHYLGWMALGLAVLAVRRGPGTNASDAPSAVSLLAPTLAFGVLALGPALVVAHAPVRLFGWELPLPLAALYAVPGSPLRLVHHPYRMVGQLMPLLGLLAGLGALHLHRPWLRTGVAGLVLAEVLLLSPAPWPVATTAVPSPPAALAALPPGPVLDWPPEATTWNRRYQLAQVVHGRPVPYGVNVFLPEPLRADPLVNRLLRALDDPQRRARNRDVPGVGRVLPRRGDADVLRQAGFSAVVVHRAALTAEEWARTERRLRAALGDPVGGEAPAVWAVR